MPLPRASLLIAGAGALVVLVDLFGTAGAVCGVAAIVLGTGLSAPSAPGIGTGEANWWGLLAAGAVLVVIGVPLGLALDTLGGVLAAIGAALVVVAVALGLR